MAQFEKRSDFDGMSVEELDAYIKSAKTAARDLISGDDISDDAISEAEAINETVSTAKTAKDTIVQAEAEKAARIEALKSATEDEPEPEPEAEAPAEEPVDETPTEEQPEAEVVDLPVEEPAEEEEPMAVAASAKTTPNAAALAAANSAQPEAPMTKSAITLLASADLMPAPKEGSHDKDALVKATINRFAQLPKGRIGGKAGMKNRFSIAEFDFSTARTDGLVQGNKDFKNDDAILAAAGSEQRLEGGSLTAAGGWCAPSEELDGFCQLATNDGLLSVPTMQANRGSVRYTPGPDFSAIYADANGDWNYTEAQVIADTEKPFMTVECPDWTEVTLGVTGTGVKAGILTNSAYPELVSTYIDNVLMAHEHKVAKRVYDAIDAAATQYQIAGGVTATDGLARVEVAVMYARQKYRLNRSQTLEALLPFWYKAVIRADLATRAGVELTNVTDQVIDAHFAMRGASVQWLHNTGQEIAAGVDVGSGIPLTIPTAVDMLAYPAGAIVRLTKDLITLNALYDSTDLKVNTYTALFTEEGFAVINRCGEVMKFALPVSATGQTGASDIAASIITAA